MSALSRHSQPKSSGGWLSLGCAVVTALGGASLAGNVAAGPGRAAIGWASLIGSAMFLLQFRGERQSSMRLARIDHGRRRDAIRLREELAEAHHRSRLAVERSYAAVARADALAAEVARLTALIRSAPAVAPAVQVLPVLHATPAQPAPIAAAPPAPVTPAPPPRPLAPAARAVHAPVARPGTTLDLPLVGSLRPAWTTPPKPVEEPAAEDAPAVPARTRVDLRAVEAPARYARGA